MQEEEQHNDRAWGENAAYASKSAFSKTKKPNANLEPLGIIRNFGATYSKNGIL